MTAKAWPREYSDVDFEDPVETEVFIRLAFRDSPSRSAHIIAVADNVHSSAEIIATNCPDQAIDVPLAHCAALLHDVGYLKPLVRTGFHPLDGYNFLLERGFDNIANLILGHSSAPEQAQLLGLDGVVASDHLIADLITYWDLRTLQGGQIVSYQERFQDIISRYGPEHVVSRSHILAKPRIERIVARVEPLITPLLDSACNL